MLAIILCLAIYIISIKRWSRFEWTIIVCMIIKYTLYVAATDAIELGKGTVLLVMFASLYSSLGPICHLIYASQYIKTCFLIKGIVKRAILLFQRNNKEIDKFELSSQWDEFVREHITIDESIKHEK